MKLSEPKDARCTGRKRLWVEFMAAFHFDVRPFPAFPFLLEKTGKRETKFGENGKNGERLTGLRLFLRWRASPANWCFFEVLHRQKRENGKVEKPETGKTGKTGPLFRAARAMRRDSKVRRFRQAR